MALFAVLAGTLVVVLAGFWYYGQKPAVHRRLSDHRMDLLLRTLWHQGYQGGALFIRGRKQLPFIQVMKYIRPDSAGLQIDFPVANWSTPFQREAETVLSGFGVLSTGGWTEAGNDMQFMTVDFGSDLEKARRCIKELAHVLSIRLEEEGRAHFEHVSADVNARIGITS